jgi:hypothetical protein
MFGHRYFGASYFAPRYWGAGGAAVVVTVTESRLKPAGPAPGSYTQRKYYLPPGWKKKKPSIAEVKKLYVEARKEIPPTEQRGLLPIAYRLEGHSTARLPPPRLVDFGRLRSDSGALKALFDAMQEVEDARNQYQAFVAEQVRKLRKRRRDEDALMLILMHID